MDMGTWLRLRAFLDDHFTVVVAVLLVLGLLGGWITYTAYVAPGTTTAERPVSSWRTASGFNHSATVTENNSVYPVGTTLTNRSVYFTRIAPRFDGTYLFTYDASERGTLHGTVSLQLVLRSVERNQRETTVVWEDTRRLQTTSFESLDPGETVRVPFSVDVNEITNRIEVIEGQLGNPPGEPETLVRATVDIDGTVNSKSVHRTSAHALPVTLQGGTYRLGRPGTWTDRRESTRTVTIPKTYGPLWRIGGPALLGVSSLVILALVSVRAVGQLSPTAAERELLAYEADRTDFDGWISTIRLPDEAFDLPQAEATSLGALVDFAIDTDTSVVEDPVDGVYYVVHDGYRYTYRPPTYHTGESRRPAVDDDESGQTDVAVTTGATTTDGGSAPPDDTEKPTG